MNWVELGANALVFTIGTVGFLLYYYQGMLIYPSHFPEGSRKIVDTPDSYKMPYENVTLRTPDGLLLKAYWIKGTENTTLIFFHANAGNMGHRLPIAYMIQQRLKCHILMLSYRGYGLSEGSANEKGMKIDALTALDYVKRHKELKDTKIILYGQSIGGAVAIHVAAQREHDVHALIVENTFTSLPALIPEVMPVLRHVTFLCHQKWPSIDDIAKIKSIPVLLLSGLSDELINPRHMKELRDTLLKSRSEGSTDKELEDLLIFFSEFTNGQHNNTCIQPGYYESIMDFWTRVKDVALKEREEVIDR